MAIEIVCCDREREFDSGVSIMEAAREIDKKASKKALVARVDDKLVDLDTKLDRNTRVELVTGEETEGLEVLRHSTAHVMAAAVKKLFPDVKVTIGPSIENGFYYDFDKSEPFVLEDLGKIEKEMSRIIKNNIPFSCRKDVPIGEAREIFSGMGEDYKVEIIDDLAREGAESVSLYTTGDFVDLCRGPHIPATGRISAFKLLDVAGAYWRGDEKNKMLQRIYGTAFASREELDDYLKRMEEAKKRDHRRLGKDLDLFSFQEEGGPGLAYWHPNGAMIRYIMEDYWRKEHLKHRYEFVYTPHIARSHLWQTSGHLDFYRENMYSPIDIEGQEYLLKPMNCPFHILIYKTRKRSYRELPLRWAELGTVYRYERSGALHGLLRVRGFTQDDAHIFCTPEQLQDEIVKTVKFSLHMITTMGFKDFDIYLATRPEGYAGTLEEWERAEGTLRTALDQIGLPHKVDEGGAVFYGPKIDIKLRDSLGREWQGPTIQFDFNLPRRFDVSYIGPDGKEHQCVMVHRALWGSMERFFGCLVEHYGGAFPLWLSPVQVQILPIADRHNDYAAEVAEYLESFGFRASVDSRREKIGFKIREAQVNKVPYMLVLGDEEIEKKKVAVRERKEGDLGSMRIDELAEILRKRVMEKE